MPKICCVSYCKKSTKVPRYKGCAPKHFHKFPENESLKEEWIRRLGIELNPTKHHVVCSKHFNENDYHLSHSSLGYRETLKPGSFPTEYILEIVPDISNIVEIYTLNATEIDSELCERNVPELAVQPGANDVYVQVQPDVKDVDVQVQPDVKDVHVQVHPDVKDVQVQASIPQKRNSYAETNDANLYYLTGLERERFEIIFKMLEKFAPIEDSLLWCKKDALLLTMHKCRHNLDFKMMEFQFEIDRRLISEIFKEVIDKLYFVLKQVDIWEMSVKDSKSYRCILDCTEFFVVRAGDPNVHQLTFSTYKNHPTFKLLVSCDEKGTVNFISEAFVGSISDREIFLKSGLIDKLEAEDAVMADKGFEISDLLEAKGVLVNIPPFLRGKQQLSDFEVMKKRIIANRRILIENVNCRAKKNKIIVTPMQKCLWPYANKIIYVCFALVNFYKPLK